MNSARSGEQPMPEEVLPANTTPIVSPVQPKQQTGRVIQPPSFTVRPRAESASIPIVPVQETMPIQSVPELKITDELRESQVEQVESHEHDAPKLSDEVLDAGVAVSSAVLPVAAIHIGTRAVTAEEADLNIKTSKYEDGKKWFYALIKRCLEKLPFTQNNQPINQ